MTSRLSMQFEGGRGALGSDRVSQGERPNLVGGWVWAHNEMRKNRCLGSKRHRTLLSAGCAENSCPRARTPHARLLSCGAGRRPEKPAAWALRTSPEPPPRAEALGLQALPRSARVGQGQPGSRALLQGRAAPMAQNAFGVLVRESSLASAPQRLCRQMLPCDT